jgi:hypothetical protein
MPDNPPVPALIDNMLAPEVFSDGAISFFLFNGVVRVVLTSLRAPQGVATPGQPIPVVIARLTMPVAAAQNLALGLNDFLEKHGLSPTAALTAGETKQ